MRSLALGKKFKLLYLLALFQLAAGPLVIVQISVLCKLTSREAHREGWVESFENAWMSEELHAVSHPPGRQAKNAVPDRKPAPEPKPDSSPTKGPVIPWRETSILISTLAHFSPLTHWDRSWFPVWPQAPPGPPPRSV